MAEHYYDSRESLERFAVQYPHVSNAYAVLDKEHGALVAVVCEEHALGMATALNAAVDSDMAEEDLLLVIQDIEPVHEWRVMRHLALALRDRIDEGYEPPEIDEGLLEEVIGDHGVAETVITALEIATQPKETPLAIDSLGLGIRTDPAEVMKLVAPDHRWRVSFMLAQLIRQAGK